MTVLGFNVVGPRVLASVVLATAMYELIPGNVTHSAHPSSTDTYSNDRLLRMRHPFQSTDRTGEFFSKFLMPSVGGIERTRSALRAWAREEGEVH